MNRTERDVTRVVESWLEDGVTQLPDRVLDAVERQLPTTHQRRAGWLARRFPIMNSTTLRYGIAAAVVVIAALVGIRFLPADIGGPGPTPTPTAEPTPSPTPQPLGTQDSLAPGRYAVPGFAAGVTVAVPSGGWSSSSSWVVIGPRGNEEPEGMAIRFFTAYGLYANPASGADGLVEMGPTGADMVQAILDHPVLEATGPTDVTIDGRAGQMVELTIPADADMTTEGQYLIFADANGGGVWGWAPGQTFNLYIAEVAGERLIFDAFHYEDTPEEDLAAQRSVVESIRFDS